MKLYLYGHEYKYAAEQILLSLFPGERPEYPEGKPEGNRMEISLSRSARYCTAVCRFYKDGMRFMGRAAVSADKLTSPILTDRHCQRLIKNAVYRAALSSGLRRPPWGALTGVRPGKLLCSLINSGLDKDTALRRFISEYDVSPERAKLCMDTAEETLKAIGSLDEKDLCLYIGIPFCPTRCSYCSFVSQSVEKSMKLIEPFLAALHREIAACAQQVKQLGLRVVSIYFGGGTPTTLSAKQLDALCCALESQFDLSGLREYTVEAGRPDTITWDKLEVLKKHGVDRISVNPQTMSDPVLEAIGRKHTAADIEEALSKVRELGGIAVNMDLIAGLPTDNAEGFRSTLDKVLELSPENITVHTLSLKKGSTITVEGAVIPGEAEVSQMLDYAGEKLRQAGYFPYYLYRQKFMSGGFENVGWTKAGYVNLYNICIMEELCSIIAMGGGGSTKLIRHDGGRNIRLMVPKYPLEYINSIDSICKEKQKISDFYTASNG